MHNLVVDIGNTNSKAAVFENDRLVEFQIFENLDEEDLKAWLRKYKITNSALSSVRKGSEELTEFLNDNTNYFQIGTALKTGINNKYKTPETLGMDRWAKIIAAFRHFKGTNCLIIDSGTCITYDLLSGTGEYFGGSISPGINMRFKALHNYTGSLPLVIWDKKADIPEGDNTENAIKNGVLRGYINEVEGYIAAYNKEYSALKILVTGGDAGFLCLQLKNSIFAPQITEDPLLVLKGLNEVITLETC